MAARAALEVAAAAASRDVVLYEHDRSRFFRLVGLFCAGQGLFWAYLAHFAFTALRPTPAPGSDPGSDPGPDDPLRPRDNKWRFAYTASCLTVGDTEGTPEHRDIEGTPRGHRDTERTPGGHRGDTATTRRPWRLLSPGVPRCPPRIKPGTPRLPGAFRGHPGVVPLCHPQPHGDPTNPGTPACSGGTWGGPQPHGGHRGRHALSPSR